MSEGKREILLGDCLELMKDIPDGSIDMILCDLPYGTTACKWDTIIPFEPLWEQYERIIKSNGAIVLFGSEPFSSYLRMSNIKLYKYDWIWNKINGGNFQLARKQPLKVHETISVFYKNMPTYNPIFTEADLTKNHKRGKEKNINIKHVSSKELKYSDERDETKRFPISILTYNGLGAECNSHKRMHGSQKRLDLIEYLIRTYTNENEIVLDNTAGSGTTAIACLKTNRQFIVMEKEPKYYEVIKKRVEDFNKRPTQNVLSFETEQ